MPVIEVSHLTKEYRLGVMQGRKQPWPHRHANDNPRLIRDEHKKTYHP